MDRDCIISRNRIVCIFCFQYDRENFQFSFPSKKKREKKLIQRYRITMVGIRKARLNPKAWNDKARVRFRSGVRKRLWRRFLTRWYNPVASRRISSVRTHERRWPRQEGREKRERNIAGPNEETRREREREREEGMGRRRRRKWRRRRRRRRRRRKRRRERGRNARVY